MKVPPTSCSKKLVGKSVPLLVLHALVQIRQNNATRVVDLGKIWFYRSTFSKVGALLGSIFDKNRILMKIGFTWKSNFYKSILDLRSTSDQYWRFYKGRFLIKVKFWRKSTSFKIRFQIETWPWHRSASEINSISEINRPLAKIDLKQ